MPKTPPKRPASNTTLSRGDAWPGGGSAECSGLFVVQSSCAKTKAAKSTSRVSSIRRSSVDVPGLKDVIQGSNDQGKATPGFGGYCARKASVGLTVEARYAGMSAAPNAAAARSSVVAAIVTGIGGGHAEELRLDEPSEHGDSTAARSRCPAAIMATASRSTSHTAALARAPSAMRMPISRVRCVTTNDITP